MPRRNVILVVVAIAVAAVCVRLGVWQLDRLGQRRARNAALAGRLALPAIEPRGTMSVDSLRQRRVTVQGVYDYGAEHVWPARSFDGTPGVALVTPLRLDDGTAVFVDRGWVPSPDAFHVDQSRYREPPPDTVTVTGIAFVPPRGRGDVQPPAAGFLPVVVQSESPEPSSGLPRRWPPPSFDDGPHLSYAIQWFSFALIALVGTAALIRKGR